VLETIIFYTLAVVLVGFGLLVITRTNPIASALSMVGAFSILAVFYALLSAPLAAVLQILVYAGGVMVLMIFVIMVLNLHSDDLKLLQPQRLVVALALITTIVVMFAPIMIEVFPSHSWSFVPVEANFGGIASVGEKIFSDYLFPFEMLSLLLLAAVVGALVLSKRKL
jgi:NADH-quinone oxidoreductase subunit J